MSFASQAECRRKSNDALLKKRRYFEFHQNVIQKFFLNSTKNRRTHKKLTARQIQRIRQDLLLEKREDTGRKLFVLVVSIIITLVILFLIVFIFTEYVF